MKKKPKQFVSMLCAAMVLILSFTSIIPATVYADDLEALRNTDIYKAVKLLNPDADFTNPNDGGKFIYDDSWNCWDGFADNGDYRTETNMCCASFVNFYLWNYLPNIAGKSSGVTWKSDPDRLYGDVHFQRIGASSVWYSVSQAVSNSSTGWSCTYDANPNMEMGLDYSFVENDYKAGKIKYQIGDILVFSNSQYRYSHVAVYAGYWNNQHWLAHCTAANGGGVMLSPFNGYSIVKTTGSIYTSKIYTSPWGDKGAIQVYKKDTDGKALAGARFKAVNKEDSSKYFYIGPTDNNGYAITDGGTSDPSVDYGTYIVTETVFPTGYESNGTTSWTVTVSATTPTVTINAVNKKITGAIAVKKTDDAGTVLSGVRFGVYSNSACTSKTGEMTTNASGIATYSGLNPGTTYYVKELAAKSDAYIQNTAVYSATVVGNQTTYANGGNNVVNDRKGRITLTKKDDGGNTLGAGYVFGIYSNQTCTTEITRMTTGSNGVATSGYLAAGTYYVKEISLPSGDANHILNPTVYKVTLGKGQTVQVNGGSVTNDRKGKITLTKTDDAGTKLGAGYVFGIYSNQACTTEVTRITTNTDGVATSGWLLSGTYYIKELSLPSTDSNHVLNPTVYKVTLGKGQTVQINGGSVTNDRKGKITLTKTDDTGTKLGAGYVFGIYSDSTCKTLVEKITTNSSGVATSGWLVAKTYYVKELSLPSGDTNHVLNSKIFTVPVAKGQTAQVNGGNVANDRKGKIALTKTDDAGAKLGAGYVFGIYSDPACKNLVEKITTGEDSTATSGWLTAGTYYVKELSMPDSDVSHNINTGTYTVEVEKGQTAKVNGGNVPNNRKTGTLEIWKSSNDKLPDGTSRPLEGIKFHVWLTSAGSYETAGDGYRCEMVTDATGHAVSSSLFYGNYTVEEVDTPPAFMPIAPFQVHIPNGDVQGGNTVKLIENEYFESGLILQKIDGKTGEVIRVPGVQFELYQINGDGTETLVTYEQKYPTQETISVWNTDENGAVYFPMELRVGEYKLVEIKQPSGYLLSDKPLEFNIENTGVNHPVLTVTFSNTPNEWIIHKSDILTAEPVPGCEISITYPDGTVKTFLTDENGNITLDRLPAGTYTWTETKTVDGYLLNQTVFTFTVAENGSISGDNQITNEPVPKIGTTATVEGEKEFHATETFTLEDEVSYEKLVPGKEYTLKGILMNKSTGKPLLIDGQQVTAEKMFTPDSPSGTVTVAFTFDSKFIKEETQIVVFESLYRDNEEIAVHADIEDEGQTVTAKIPEIGTTATVEGEKEFNATEVFTLIDAVAYSHLTPGKEYTLKGVLTDKATGKPLLIDGQQVTAEKMFTPDSPSGTVTVAFTFDSKFIKEETQIVVFESLYRDNEEIAVHADIEDEGQTVTAKIPEIGTTATIDGAKEAVGSDIITITDEVNYSNLTPGKEYILKGKVIEQNTGLPLLINGKQIMAEKIFTPDAPSGTETLTFDVDMRYINDVTTLVVFEGLYRDGVKIAVHADINDGYQTVRVRPRLAYLTVQKESNNPDFILSAGFENRPIAGAVYGLYTLEGELLHTFAPTDENGLTDTATVRAGQYYIQEITAAPGYQLNTEKYPVTIDESNALPGFDAEIPTVVIKVSDPPEIGTLIVPELETPPSDTQLTTPVPGTPIQPGTGGNSHIGFFIILAVLSGLSALILWKHKTAKHIFRFFSLLLCAGFLLFPSVVHGDETESQKESITVTIPYDRKGDETFTAPATYTAEDGTVYELVEGSIELKETKLPEETTTVTYEGLEEKDVDAPQTIQKDGKNFNLTNTEYQETVTPRGQQDIEATTSFGIQTVEPQIPQTKQVTFQRADTGERESISLPLVNTRITTPWAWREESRTITLSGYGSAYYTLNGAVISPSVDGGFTGQENTVRQAMGLPEGQYRVLSLSWVGEPYEKDGLMMRDATVQMEKYCAEFTAYYAASIQLDDEIRYTATLTYTANNPEDAEYSGVAYATYQLPEPEPESSGLEPWQIVAIAAGSLVVLAVLITAILFLLAKKRKKKKQAA